jgi:hypothetical protein
MSTTTLVASLAASSSGSFFASIFRASTIILEAGLMEQEQHYQCPAILP